MCGYVERDLDGRDSPLREVLQAQLLLKIQSRGLERFYPAFGGSQKSITDVIINPAGEVKTVDAVWWYDCKPDWDNLVPQAKYGFNARHLNYPIWQDALRHRRAIVLATGIGEARQRDKAKFLMRSDEVFALGALYNSYPNGRYSVTIITRNPHPRFSEYHEKALPFFLPMDQEFIKLWLDPSVECHPEIDHELGNPKLRPTFHVQQVKTYSKPTDTETVTLNRDN